MKHTPISTSTDTWVSVHNASRKSLLKAVNRRINTTGQETKDELICLCSIIGITQVKK